jgi:hypothetical protein
MQFVLQKNTGLMTTRSAHATSDVTHASQRSDRARAHASCIAKAGSGPVCGVAKSANTLRGRLARHHKFEIGAHAENSLERASILVDAFMT